MTIEKKLNRLFTGIIMILSSVMAVIFMLFELNRINRVIGEKGNMIAANLAENIGFPMFVGDEAEVHKIIDRIFFTSREITRCVLRDKEGKIIYEKGINSAGHRLYAKSVQREKVRKGSEEAIFGIDASEIEVLGDVQIYLSAEESKNTLVKIVTVSFAITVIAVLLASIMGNFFINRVVAAPIRRLVEGTEKVAGGEFAYVVNAGTDDEIGVLADAFNKMTSDLSNSIVSKNYMESIFGSIMEALFITDSKGIIVMANTAAVEITGEPKDHIVGVSIREYFGDVDIYKAALNRKNEERECRGIPVLFGASFITGNGGEQTGFACVAADVSQIKDAEDRLRKAFVKIEKYTEELEDTNAKLKQADRLKSNFLSMVSHELRTPLTSIKGYLSFLLKGVSGPINETQKDYLESISRNSERLLKLINDLVDITKMEKGTFAINPQDADIISVVEKCIREMAPLLESGKVGIERNYDRDKLVLKIDEYRISQVIINILNNAVKFSPGNSRIKIKMNTLYAAQDTMPAYLWRPEMGEKQYCLISVSDQGIGMENQYLGKIFDRFYQIEDINTRKYQGLGLGLNIAKIITEAHGGVIWAESEGKGKGTSFVIMLPCS